MAALKFLKGLRASLPTTVKEGNVYICTDERSMYIDIAADQRIRIGDFQEFDNLTALNANTNPSTTALYYVKDINCLCKFDGTKYVQINLDTGATSFEVTGEGNVITGVSYDSATRKLTLTKGLTAATPAEVDTKIDTKVGAISGTVKDYIDEKTNGIATDAALGELQTTVDAHGVAIDALELLVGEEAVADQIDAKIEALNLAETYEPIGEAGKVQTALNEYKTANDAAVKKVSDDLADEITRAEAAEVANAAAAKAADDKAVAAQGEIDALEQLVGTPDEGKTVVQMIKDVPVYDDTEVKADIAENAAAITELQGEIDAQSLTLADVKADVDAFFKDADLTESAKDTLKEIQSYIDSDAEAAGAMTASIQQNAQDIDAVEGRLDVVEPKVTTLEGEMDAVELRAGTLEGKMTTVEGKVDVLEGKAHTHTFVESELNKIADGDVAKWNASEQNAKDYADELAEGLDGRVELLEAIEHHEHANKAELDLIQSGDVAKWNAAEQNAKDYADGLAGNYDAKGAAAAAKSEAVAHADAINVTLTAADATNLQAAKDYTDSVVGDSLTWGSF